MTITFLGTGSSQGVPVIACSCPTCLSSDTSDHRLRSAVHLTQHGQSVLIDPGPDLRYQVLRAGIKRLDTLLVTHEHRDHTGGLGEVRSFVLKQKQPVAIYACARVLAYLQQAFSYLFPKASCQATPNFTLHTIEDHAFAVDRLTVVPIQVYHNALPVCGFRIGAFTYITDAKVISEAAIAKMRGTRVLVVNALRKTAHPAHFNLEEALALAKKVNPEVTYLTHISHQMGLHEVVSKTLPANVHLAHDGLQVKL